MNNKQKLVYLSLIALTIIGILSGASYAYFSIENKIGNETVIESGTMALTFTDGSTITADKLIPGEYIEKTFSVRNTGTVRTNYDIYLSEVVNTFVNQSDLVYEIISSNGYNTSNQIQVPNTETKIINNYPIDPLQEHTYTLRITYKLTNEVQNDNMGRTFIAKINVNEYNSNNSERYIKLIDSSNNLLDKQVITNNTDYYYNLNNYDLTNSTNIYCNNGGIPTIENNILKVSEVTTATDCRISTDIVDTINNKLTTSKTGIVMTNTQDNVIPMTIPSNEEVILDLNGKEINSMYVNETISERNDNHHVFIIFGTFTINDSIGTGGVYTGTASNPIYIYNNANVIINSGNYNGRQSIYISGNSSYTKINGGNFYSKIWETINIYNSNNNEIEINGGNFYNSAYAKTIFIDGSSTDNLLTINNGTVRSSGYAGIYVNGSTINNNVYINDGNFESSGVTISNDSASGNIFISGGYFESTNSNTVYNTGTTNITGGTFISENNNTENNRTIKNNGELNITQTDKPIYILSKATLGGNNAGIDNSGISAIVNINANQANKCTNNYRDTTSGLCIYGANKAFSIKSVKSNTNIIGGTYISEGASTLNGESANYKIKNAYVSGAGNNIYNGNYYPNRGEADPGTYNICSSTIKGSIRDLFEHNTSAYITYSNDNIFSNGTNTPASNKVYGSVNPTGAACDW